MRWRPLLVVLLISLAGCGSGLTDGPEETVTPADVPEVTPNNEQHRGDVVPGVANGEIRDVDLLARSHIDAVRNRSYVWREQRSVDDDPMDGSAFVGYRQFARVESSYVYYFWSRRSQVRIGPYLRHLANYTEYGDGERRHIRYRFPASAEHEYAQDSRVRAAEHRYIGQEAGSSVRRYLDFDRASVEPTTVDGRRHYRIEGRTADLPGVDPIDNYTATALVSQTGFVRSLEASYLTTQLNETREVTYTFEYDRVNETTVSEPDWVSETSRFARGN